MIRLKFIFSVLLLVLFVRPHRWQYEYKILKERYYEKKENRSNTGFS